MCGICGFVSSNNPSFFGGDILKRMLAVIRHRGPDDEGSLIDGNAAFGAKRLKVIDLISGHQPIHDEKKRFWVVLNGEIYNYQELRRQLREKGHVFYTDTDTEVIAHLFEDHGCDCASRLEGMFAFAVWDSRERRFFLCRDRFGIKPLYYSVVLGSFVFASEPKALLEFPGVSRQIDLTGLDEYFTFEYVPAPRSIFKDIRKLPAGCQLTYQGSEIKVDKYWDIDLFAKSRFLNEPQAVDGLLSLLTDSVRKYLRSDVPAGVFLSGGIDSGLITALSSGFAGGNGLKTFSIGFEDDSFDESCYFRQVAQLYRTRHFHRVFNCRDLISLIPEATGLLDEPLADASFFPTYLLSRFARQNITVALSGEGGDELFAGYPTYQAHRLAGYYNRVPAFLRNRIDKLAGLLPVSMRNFSFDFKAKRFVSAYSLPAGKRHIAWMGSFMPADKAGLYTAALKERLPEEGAAERVINDYMAGCSQAELLDRMQYLDIKTYLQDGLLVKTDRASMANSLEARLPYLDHRLVEFVFRLPQQMRLRGFGSKYILKKAAVPFLPAGIVNRRKKGFGVPIGSWIRKDFKRLILDFLDADKIKKQGLLDCGYVNGLLDRHFRGKADNRKKIWTIFMFELWASKYL
ncbi:MAG: asparagine synthase (glutamine-hydrolyzing) [Candidatus Omnitrophica bacterium]|jgi:asparagine synthase (glutamine-hydrolysing)|nr:asparagine synthase (glutamine-hydrolyzing) [Candidatus Omnitrophota bacterium]MDD5080130.1 asparagine synthase (glutamine-hydrolyzing) [Candidatus Omnitrophota bacterium]